MEFDTPKPRRMAEPFVPMINVVFLLLIFFLMTAQIAPPEPFDLTPPEATEGGAPTSPTVLHLSKDAVFGFADLRGDEAVASAVAAAQASADGALRLRVDGGAAATALAGAAAQLARAGVARLEIVTAARR